MMKSCTNSSNVTKRWLKLLHGKHRRCCQQVTAADRADEVIYIANQGKPGIKKPGIALDLEDKI